MGVVIFAKRINNQLGPSVKNFDVSGYNFLDGLGIMWDVNAVEMPLFLI